MAAQTVYLTIECENPKCTGHGNGPNGRVILAKVRGPFSEIEVKCKHCKKFTKVFGSISGSKFNPILKKIENPSLRKVLVGE